MICSSVGRREAAAVLCLSPELSAGPSKCKYAMHAAARSDWRKEGAAVRRDAVIPDASCTSVFSQGRSLGGEHISRIALTTSLVARQWAISTWRQLEGRGWQSCQPGGVSLCDINNTRIITLDLTWYMLVVFFPYNLTYPRDFPCKNYYYFHLQRENQGIDFSPQEHFLGIKHGDLPGPPIPQSLGCALCHTAGKNGQQLNRQKQLFHKMLSSVKFGNTSHSNFTCQRTSHGLLRLKNKNVCNIWEAPEWMWSEMRYVDGNNKIRGRDPPNNYIENPRQPRAADGSFILHLSTLSIRRPSGQVTSHEKQEVSGAVADRVLRVPLFGYHWTGKSEIQRSHLRFQYCPEPTCLNLWTSKSGIVSSSGILRAWREL